jgi:branched-subunit amino acid ABC-type transport system permease component
VDLAVVVLLQVVASVASLALISVGLAVIFGMMRVINLAHGELIMLGGYAVIYATRWGVNLWIAMLIVAPLFVGVIGMIVERTVIRFLYGRMIDTMLATWGLSLLLIGAATMIFGNTTTGVSAPLGGVTIGTYQTSLYELVLVVIVAVVLLGLMAVL